jgi:dUTP pyrophosphatase
MIKDIKNFTSTMAVLKDLMEMSSNQEKMQETMSMLEQQIKDYKPKVGISFVNKSDNPDPFYNYGSDSGFDLLSNGEVTIPSKSWTVVPTGLYFDIPYGYEIQVRSKSGLALNKGISVLNSPGTVDSGYNGEIKVILMNNSTMDITIHKGMKVAQAVLAPVLNGDSVNLNKVNEINEKDRNANGFGSTGV